MQNTSFIRLYAKYRERGDVLTRDNHEIMRAISAAFRFILTFYARKLYAVLMEKIIYCILSITNNFYVAYYLFLVLINYAKK